MKFMVGYGVTCLGWPCVELHDPCHHSASEHDGSRMNDEERRRFREAAADCTPTMIRLAYLITGSQPAAERALQRALSKTARRWPAAESRPEHHIISTLCRDQAGWWHKWDRSGPDGGHSGAAAHRDADDDASPDRSDLHSAMRRAVRSLPRPERVVIALQEYEDLTAVETAQVLGWSEKRVQHRTERARARLRELLAALSAPDNAGYVPDDATSATLDSHALPMLDVHEPEPLSQEPAGTGRHTTMEASA